MDANQKALFCPLTEAYIPRLVLCAVVGFIFIASFEFILHAKILANIYDMTPHLWRPESEMPAYFGYGLLMQFLTAFLTAAIYSRGHEGKGVGEGLRYGLLIGLFMGVSGASALAWMPISLGLAQAWFAGGLVQGLCLGVIYSVLYTSPCCAKGSCENKAN